MRERTERRRARSERVLPKSGDAALAKGLGAFSIGLGLAEVLAPGALASLIGIRPRPILFRLLGLREIASGVAVLSGRKPAGALWSRVAGDAIDLGFLGAALASPATNRRRALFATANVCGVTALDVLGAIRHTKKTQRVVRTLAVNKTPDECYAFWRNLERVARGPGKVPIEWDAEIVRDEPGSLIAWRSLAGSTVETRGVVEFKTPPSGRGTIVHVALFSMTGPELQLKEDLRRFKQVIETGEVPTTEGQPKGGVS
ncbi:MAG: hypothetical protein ACAI25_11750 [Planctomycetota bacterium]